MDWRIKAGFQKILSKSRIGDKINHLSALIDSKYYTNGSVYHYHECLRKYRLVKNNLSENKNKTALEIGTGYFLIEPIVLKLIGFEKIITIDVAQDLNFKAVKKQIDLLTNKKEFIDEIKKISILASSEIDLLLTQIQNKNSLQQLLEILNISYIAPYQLQQIEQQNIKFDYVFSQVVLEHIEPEFLGQIFYYIKKWLKPNGYSVHTVNFVDHFTNEGFWEDKSISEFNFLKHSDQYWNFWAGNSIAYTNRLNYPFYTELCEEHGLRVINFIGENYKGKKYFDVNLVHPDVKKKYRKPLKDLNALVQYQRGTFVIVV